MVATATVLVVIAAFGATHAFQAPASTKGRPVTDPRDDAAIEYVTVRSLEVYCGVENRNAAQ